MNECAKFIAGDDMITENTTLYSSELFDVFWVSATVLCILQFPSFSGRGGFSKVPPEQGGNRARVAARGCAAC